MNTPSLASFRYSSSSMSKISMNAPNLLDADIQVLVECERKTYDMEWYISLINFLSGLNGAKNRC
ncbi:hypothetical protein TorRG33x02_161700 [Trema orientale]|uniref:Uncharacterized protein n=1 Tax=Trema orientale TaxID=63057 RepID=A0A2P5EQY5_TREOI|nr:hypothetical protein TorRG33x02_161700 [Trema orientale]